MGVCMSLNHDELLAKQRSHDIDRRLSFMARKEENVVKLLLLGAGESGKSTFVKQMKIIHNSGFSAEERCAFKSAILDNLLNSMKFVLQGMVILRINLSNIKNKIHAQTVLCYPYTCDDDVTLPPFLGNALRHLWRDRGVRAAAKRGFEYELNDSALYYFNHIRRLTSSDYIPTVDDVLRVRIRTLGVMESQFRFSGILFRVFDVGGQRTERRKWIACFDHVRAVLFVAALSGYDMTLLEDSSVNRLRESLKLFGSICNNAFFNMTSMILFLNKYDLFEKKIKRTKRHMRYYFPEYEGRDGDVDFAADFVKANFLALNRNAEKVVYPHFTTATNTEHIEIVFHAVMDTIIRENLESASLL
ncbi:guanine nucleotide-binding protein G(o) subunit alpha-like [Styela clava]|uniref:guanine nucleotide-binding protein G(o) subunit alpha-like n=1 Tax=Styela clava TaxID=7725 RepID=UPI00193ABA43|nr:guanine nucleotide-binding protein G(o) subunit alpha-like [Styela clava]